MINWLVFWITLPVMTLLHLFFLRPDLFGRVIMWIGSLAASIGRQVDRIPKKLRDGFSYVLIASCVVGMSLLMAWDL